MTMPPNPRSALDARTALCFRIEAHSPGASESEPPIRMPQKYTLIALVIIAIAGMGVLYVLRPKFQDHGVANNLRAVDADTLKQMQEDEAAVLALFPYGTPFSNMVAAWGSNYSTTGTNKEGAYYARFRCKLPGRTNQSVVQLQIKSNVVDSFTYLKVPYEYVHGAVSP